MWLAFIILGMVAGCVFLGLCVAEATWRQGGTPSILLWIMGTYGVALAFLSLCLIAFAEVA